MVSTWNYSELGYKEQALRGEFLYFETMLNALTQSAIWSRGSCRLGCRVGQNDPDPARQSSAELTLCCRRYQMILSDATPFHWSWPVSPILLVLSRELFEDFVENAGFSPQGTVQNKHRGPLKRVTISELIVEWWAHAYPIWHSAKDSGCTLPQ